MSSSDLPIMDAPEGKDAKLEEMIRRAAADFPYPATPNIAARERARLTNASGQPVGSRPARRPTRFTFALALALIMLAAAMLVSPVRARVLDWIRIGAVGIFFTQPTATVTATLPAETPAPAGAVQGPVTATPALLPSATPLASLLQMGGATTLERAREQVGYPILLPAYPEDLGEPDYVYIQRFSTAVVFLVWADEAQPGRVSMSLSMAGSDQPIFEKYDPRSVVDTQVHGEPAVWIEGDYVMALRDGDFTMSRLITSGHVLIWDHDGMTFRMETDEALEEAIRIAESIR